MDCRRYLDRGGDESPREEDEEDVGLEEEEGREGGRAASGTKKYCAGRKKDLQGPPNARREPAKQDARCVTAGVNAPLDFTLNCNSVRLTCRDGRTAARSGRGRLETRC